MTCIAYDHKKKEISVDSLATVGDGSQRWGMVTKFCDMPDGSRAFACGDLAAAEDVFASLKTSQTPDADNYKDCTIVVVRHDGSVWEYDGPTPLRITKSWAWGSGDQFALGALFMGASSRDAVAAAIKYSTSCGGKIHTFKTR